MTLCEKLEELGYVCHNPRSRYYKYYYDLNFDVCIELCRGESEIYDWGIVDDYDESKFIKQEEIDNYQIAFNRVKADVKELKKWLKTKTKLTK